MPRPIIPLGPNIASISGLECDAKFAGAGQEDIKRCRSRLGDGPPPAAREPAGHPLVRARTLSDYPRPCIPMPSVT